MKYEKPAVIHESTLTTRAGSAHATRPPKPRGVEPSELFSE